jgi:hypothetical protein
MMLRGGAAQRAPRLAQRAQRRALQVRRAPRGGRHAAGFCALAITHLRAAAPARRASPGTGRARQPGRAGAPLAAPAGLIRRRCDRRDIP